eukprot:83949-Amphidinium_carterae.1
MCFKGCLQDDEHRALCCVQVFHYQLLGGTSILGDSSGYGSRVANKGSALSLVDPAPVTFGMILEFLVNLQLGPKLDGHTVPT